jgi:hypothetical protein
MKFGFQQKLPEEIELEHKRDELASLCAQHQAAQAVLQQARDEIGQFERRYDQHLGRRIAELERIEGEISRLTEGVTGAGSRHQGAPSEEPGKSHRAGGERSESAVHAGRGDTQDIKALYREVAKAIHPDLAGQGVGELERHELMSRANRAYAQLDHRTLQDILSKWKRSPGKVDGTDVAAELVRVIRQIARERQEILALNAKVQELKDSYVCRFKLKVEAQLAQGTDLFAEMVAAADLNIARALKRLAQLKGDSAQHTAGAPAQRREICFPAEPFCGTVYLRDRDSLNFSQWRKFGPAKGCLEVGADQAVRLDVKAAGAVELSQMEKIQPNDLQALYLYEIADDDLESIAHLTGLEELYLSGTRLTDAALRGIHRLSNLKRIYLYQTVITDLGLVHLARLPGLKGLTSSGNSITDEGLALFQRSTPGVKTVSFPWKFGR